MELNLHPERRVLRQFAGAWLLFVGGLGVWKWVARGASPAAYGLVAAGIVLGLMGLAAPGAVRWLYVAATLLTFPIGWVVSKLLLAVLYYVVLLPIGVGFRLMRRDRLRLKQQAGGTCWIAREETTDPARYLRQF